MNFYTRKRRMPAVIIVSLIDIFAILLIFVIVTSTFKKSQPTINIKYPESTTGVPNPQTQAPNLAEVSVSPEGIVKLDGVEVALEELSGKIAEMVATKRPLALKADTKAPFGVIVRVLDSLKEAGVTGNLPAFTETVKKL